MLSKVFAVYDSKVETFHNPFVQRTIAEAKRSFQQIANDMSTAIGKYPEDYALFEIADWDDSKGELRPHAAPISHGLALNYKKVENADLSLATGSTIKELRKSLEVVSEKDKVVQ